MHHSTSARTGAVALAAVLSMSLMSACSSGGSEADEATGEFDWQRYSGETLRLVALRGSWQEAITPELGDFEELTGMDVEIESLPEDQFRQRLQVELTAGSDAIDVFMTSVQQDGTRFADSGWYEDLSPYLENDSLTEADYDFDAMSPSVIEGHTFDGTLSALPVQLEVQMLFYRKDLLKAAGYDAPPATLVELEEIAAATNDPENGVYGFSARGKRANAVTQLTSFLRGYGADYVDADGQAAFDTPEAIAAIEKYGQLVREYGPSGAVNNSWEELLPLFQSGSLAMWPDNSGQAVGAGDPEANAFADSVGYAPMPAGPAAEAQTFFGWSLGISAESQKKNAAWLFLQWATNAETAEAVQGNGVPSARPGVPFGDDVPAEFVETFQSSIDGAGPMLPQVRSVPEVRDVIGDVIVTSIEGGDVPAAVQEATEEFDRIAEYE